MPPRSLTLQDLEQSEAIRWVDLFASGLANGEALALLAPICRGELTTRMVRDLITPRRFPAGREYPRSGVSITAAFRTRHVQAEGAELELGVTSVFEPVHLLVGSEWMVSCWLPPRVFRGDGEALQEADQASAGLFIAVAESWQATGGETAADLADLIRRELAIAAGYRVEARS
jgi:hypothetical protein